jgi:hypothetical protein
MTEDRSRQSLLEFLDYLSNKGLMAKATAANRKAAVSKVLGILPSAEASDVTTLDLDEVMRRFTNLEGKGYTPGSLTTYLSRLRSAIDDFKLYLENPMGFRPSVQPRERRKVENRKDVTASESKASPRQPAIEVPISNALSIPIRLDATVLVQGLPYDLTENEAAKIANVIRAMAMPA